MESRSFGPTGLDALPRLDANMDAIGDALAPSAPLEGNNDAMELDGDQAIQQVGSVTEEDVSGVSEVKDNNVTTERLEDEKEKKKKGGKVEEDIAGEIKEEVPPAPAPTGTSIVTNSVTADTTAAAGDIAAPAVPSALVTTPPPRQLRSPDVSDRLPVSQPQLSTPQQQVENMRRAVGACRPLIFNDIPPPSPIVEPGALHELGDPTSPNRRRSSANAGIAGLEELRRDRMDQLIHATGFDGASGNSQELEYEHTIDAFIKLNFDDGNVYYVKNSSVIFGRMEGATSNTFQQIGPDGSTVIGGGGGFGFEHPTTSGVMGMKREKKKRRKKKDDMSSKKSKSTTSGGSSAAAPVASRRGSAFQGQPQFPLFRDPFGLQYGNRSNHFTQEDETPIIYLPPPNPSGEQEVASAAPPKKNISRRHAKLAYNAVRGWFELDIMGKNGAFVNEEFVQVGTKLIIDPKEGTKVQIGGVSFVVYVPEHLEGGPEAIEPPAASGGMGKGKGGKGEGGKGKSAKGKMSFSFSDGDDMESGLSDPDVAIGDDDEDSVDGSDSGGNESGEESGQDSSEEDEEGEDEEGETGDIENSEEVEGSGEDFPSPEPTKVEKRGRGRPRKDQTEAQRKELAKAKAAAERVKAKEKEKLQREKLAAQRRERELEKQRDKKRLEAQRQKEERRRQKERLQKEKEKKRLHLPVSAKGGGAKGGGEEAKKERKLYLPPPPLAKSEEPSTPTQEWKGPGRPPRERKLEAQARAQIPPQPLPPQQPSPSTQHPQQERLMGPQDNSEVYHSYHDDLQGLAPLAAANKAMSVPIDPALSYDLPQVQPAPIVHQQAPKEQKKGKPKKEKPPPKRKRTPSPEINEADLPPEALLKPSASYVVLIHEAISSSERGALTLPEIYKAIERKYPYYKLRVTTNGWQSSVRHNLGQHKAFYKVERSGKGWLWSCEKGVSIEKEKKPSAATRSASYAPGVSNGPRSVQNGQVPSVQYPLQPIPQPPQYFSHSRPQQPQCQQAPPVPSTASAPRPAYHAPIPSAASSKQQQPPANAQSGGPSPDFSEAIVGLQALIQQHKDAPGPHSPELLKTANEVVRGLMDKDPGAMEAIRKLTAIIKQIDQTKVATQSPVPQQQYQKQHGQIQPDKGKGVAASAVAQLAGQNSVAGGAPVAASNHAPAPTPQANRPPVPINIKDLSPEEKAALVKRLLLVKKQKEQAAAAAAANRVSSAGPSVAVSTPALLAPAPTQTSPLYASSPVVKPVPAPIPSPAPIPATAAPVGLAQLPTTPTSTKRPRELEPEPQDLEAKRQNTG